MDNTIYGVWLFYPLADCPPDGWSTMDEPTYGFPGHGLPTVTNRRQLASATRPFDHWWPNL